jgi:hypothetical protein
LLSGAASLVHSHAATGAIVGSGAALEGVSRRHKVHSSAGAIAGTFARTNGIFVRIGITQGAKGSRSISDGGRPIESQADTRNNKGIGERLTNTQQATRRNKGGSRPYNL